MSGRAWLILGVICVFFMHHECEAGKNVLPCDDRPCKNGATCIMSTLYPPDNYKCECREGYDGKNCEIVLKHPCDDAPCKNGATCKNLDESSYECACPEGYIGQNCETENSIKGSGILDGNVDFHKNMNKWLKSVTDAKSSWVKCYTASKDGWSSDKFHVGCDYHGPTVTLVKVGISVFGGYTDREWEWTNREEYLFSDRAFLFSLRNNAKLPAAKLPLLGGHSNKATFTFGGHGPVFGEGPDLFIATNANKNKLSNSKLGTSYKLPSGKWSRYFLAGYQNFRVDEIEVYYEKKKA